MPNNTRSKNRTTALEPKEGLNGAPKAKPKKPLSRAEMEQAMRAIHRLVEGKQFANAKEANAFLSTLIGKSPQKIFETAAELTPREQAQELAFDAMEAESDAKARRLAKRALVLDPDCVDALVVMTELEANGPRDLVQGLAKAVQAGERALGPEFFKENKGDFWGLMETRPYMRARQQLADMLKQVGMEGEAIGHYEAMLELNPNDNQGVRYSLLGCYLSMSNLDGAARLLRDYKEDIMASFAWGQTLYRFLKGDAAGARAALSKARKSNRFVELYLLGGRELPDELPESYALGSEEEAVVVILEQVHAWAAHPEAVKWLAAEVEKHGCGVHRPKG